MSDSKLQLTEVLMGKLLTSGELGNVIGCQSNHIRRAIELGLIREPQRLGPNYVFTEKDVPIVRDAVAQVRLRKRGRPPRVK